MGERAFDVAAFHARMGASVKERNWLRQDLVRGLKDYYESAYGYDRYGAETIFMVPERMGEPYVYGFAMLRILHDRRLSVEVKRNAALLGLDLIAYGQDQGLPHGLFNALDFLIRHDRLAVTDLRFALIVSAGEYSPFRGLDKAGIVHFMDALVNRAGVPGTERAFWAHSLIARHQDGSGSAEVINLLLGAGAIEQADRMEVCRSWIHFRQPNLVVDVPDSDGSPREAFVAEHMPFWVAHVPSWPTANMVRLGLIWLARLGGDALALAETYIDYRNTYADQVQTAVAEIVAEHHERMPREGLKRVIEKGSMAGAIAIRRRFYRLGADIFGAAYLERAAEDPAGSVRQWALRELQKQT